VRLVSSVGKGGVIKSHESLVFVIDLLSVA
jgi:hypothetical protein